MTLPIEYDTWRLAGPDERHEIGTEGGQPCGRYHKPDDDAPREYKPKPCPGVMQAATDGCGDHWTECDTCGEEA